jgi:SAM-dependent methyltransferase
MRQRSSVDRATVEGFGYEWTKFDQAAVDPAALEKVFREYFALFPWDSVGDDAVGVDLGCGSGRWARLAAERTGRVIGADASLDALRSAARTAPECPLVLAAAGALPFRAKSLDFGYSLGVLHHVPDPARGLEDAVRTLKPGAPFLVYVYYALDNRPSWFQALWRSTDLLRQVISRCPAPIRYGISQMLAIVVYFPLARTARLLERRGIDVESLPLAAYRDRSVYVMRTDALDRFGTRLEKRFTKAEVAALLRGAGLEAVTVGDEPPFWCAVGWKPVEPT